MTTSCWGSGGRPDCESRAGLCDFHTLSASGVRWSFFSKLIYIITTKRGHGKIQPFLLKCDIGLPATVGQGATTQADISHAQPPRWTSVPPSLCASLSPGLVFCPPQRRWWRGGSEALAFPLAGRAVHGVWLLGLGLPKVGSSAPALNSEGRSRLHCRQRQFQINEVSVLTPGIYAHFPSPACTSL